MSGPTLVLMPSRGVPTPGKPWALALRYHDLGGVEYRSIARVSDEDAMEIIQAGGARWLYGEPNWKEIFKARELEEADQLEARAAEIRARLGHPSQQPS